MILAILTVKVLSEARLGRKLLVVWEVIEELEASQVAVV